MIRDGHGQTIWAPLPWLACVGVHTVSHTVVHHSVVSHTLMTAFHQEDMWDIRHRCSSHVINRSEFSNHTSYGESTKEPIKTFEQMYLFHPTTAQEIIFASVLVLCEIERLNGSC